MPHHHMHHQPLLHDPVRAIGMPLAEATPQARGIRLKDGIIVALLLVIVKFMVYWQSHRVQDS
jgi:hypothetical protein